MIRSFFSLPHKYRYHASMIAAATLWVCAAPVIAQENNQDNSQDDSGFSNGIEPIIVNADRIRGSVITASPPIAVLSEDDIASYGADSVADLLAAISPQTGSARGRGGSAVILINAQQVSGFRELRNIPPEAIIRVEILPEEVALKYGFKPDQRVINFILKDNFSSIDINGGFGGSTAGGQITTDIGSTYTKFSKNSRFNADIDYETESIINEDERNIIQENISDDLILAGPIGTEDIAGFRSLAPRSEKLELSLSYSRNLSETTNISFNAGYNFDKSLSFFGLNDSTFILPASNAFNNSGAKQNVQRFFIEPRPLQSTSQSNNFDGGFNINTEFFGLQWSTTADASFNNNDSQIDQNSDFGMLQQLLLDDDSANIFSDVLNPNVGPAQIINSSTKSVTFSNFNTISGTLLSIPNGEIYANLYGGYDFNRIDSDSDQSGVNVNTTLSRNITSFGGSIDIPILEAGAGLGRYLGDISINGNAGVKSFSDFGDLPEYGYSILWTPFDDLTLTYTAINEDSAPSVGQLGSPIVTTPNIPIFDFTQSQTSFIQLTSGGNPNLVEERLRDIKISLNYTPKQISGLDLIVDYTRNSSFNTSNGFPLLTAEIEAAFPDRVTRNQSGTLLALDRTPVTFDRVDSERIRYGFSFSKSLSRRGGRGRPEGTARGRTPEAGGARPAADTPNDAPSSETAQTNTTAPNNRAGQSSTGNGGAPSAANGSATGGRAIVVPRRPGRYNISIYHTIALDETISIRPDVAELDLLNGSAIGGNGGAARHQIELEGGLFNNGLGLRISADYRSATTVNGDLLTGSSDLRFGALATINARLFYDLGSKTSITKALPFLKGSRISLRVNNVFNAIQNITDENGDVPINFQRGFIDPIGRSIDFRFRKRF